MGALAGITDGIRILALYHALVPASFGIINEGMPANVQIIGFIFALAGV